MSDDRKTERLEERINEVRRQVRWVEDHLMERQRFWKRVSERAFLLGAMVVATVAAVTVAERRAR